MLCQCYKLLFISSIFHENLLKSETTTLFLEQSLDHSIMFTHDIKHNQRKIQNFMPLSFGSAVDDECLSHNLLEVAS